MIQDKVKAGHLLFDLKTDRTHLLQTAAAVHHSHSTAVPPFFTSPHVHSHSPPIPALDLYSAYAYQQQLQQHLLAAPTTALYPQQHLRLPMLPALQVNNSSSNCEVLDLSRRCDSVETNRKTPSPYHSNSSNGSISPSGSSPNTTSQTLSTSSTASIASHLLPSTQHQLSYSSSIRPVLPTPISTINFAALYPGLRSSEPIKQDISTNPTTIPSVTPSNPLAITTMTEYSTETISSTYSNSLAVALTYAPAPSLVGNPRLLPTLNPLKPELSEVQKTIESHPISNTAGATTASNSNANILPAIEGRTTRPFKAYPRDPLVIAANFAANDVLLDNPRVERYTEYRKRVLEQIRNSNGGSRTVSNPKMRRMNSRSISINEDNGSDVEDRQHTEESSDCDSSSGRQNNPTTSSAITTSNSSNSSAVNSNGVVVKDAAYYERRRKNNAAAKKSRDRRRIKEDEIAIRAAYLERQNIELLCQIDALKAQLATYTTKVVV